MTCEHERTILTHDGLKMCMYCETWIDHHGQAVNLRPQPKPKKRRRWRPTHDDD